MADIVRWNPIRETLTLRDAINQIFDDAPFGASQSRPMSEAASMLPLDLYETDDHLVIEATVPGVKPEDIEVTVTGNLLTIKTESKTEKTEEKRNYLRQERSYGRCCRQVTLPDDVDTDKVEATFEHGVLVLALPKTETSKSKTVKVVTK